MSKIALTPNASGTGTFTLAAPNSNTSRTITLPDEAGEVLVNTATGVDITGTITSDGLTVDASGTPASLNRTDGNAALLELKTSGSVRGYIGADTTGSTVFYSGAAAERMRIDSSGNVGIGTSSPASALQVVGGVENNQTTKGVHLGMLASSYAVIEMVGAAGGDGWIDFKDTNDTDYSERVRGGTGAMEFHTNAAERMRIDSSGNVGINMIAPNSDLHVNGSITSSNLAQDASTSKGLSLQGYGDSSYINMSGNGNLIFRMGSTFAEAMRLDGGGNLLVGTTSSLTNSSASGLEIRSNGQLKVGGSAAVDNVILSTGTTGTKYFISHYQNGTYVGAIIGSGVGLSLSSASDYRLKENVSAITGATERLKQLNPSRFNFVSAPDTTFDGFLAHEVQSVVPEAVTGTKDAMRDEEYEVTPAVYEDVVIPAVLDEDGNELEAERTEQQLVTEAVMGTRSVPNYQGIDQSKLVPLLTAALQEALTEISDLKARVTALEAV